MTNLVIFNYYYRYRQSRKLIKDLVDISDYTQAKSKLDSIMQEHNQKYSSEILESRKDFNYGERIMLQHSLNHLNAVIDKNDPEFFENGILKHQSDIVKEGLVREPKQDYTDSD